MQFVRVIPFVNETAKPLFDDVVSSAVMARFPILGTGTDAGGFLVASELHKRAAAGKFLWACVKEINRLNVTGAAIIVCEQGSDQVRCYYAARNKLNVSTVGVATGSIKSVYNLVSRAIQRFRNPSRSQSNKV